MPLQVEITFENGAKEFHHFPVEIWEQGPIYKFVLDFDGAVVKVVINPRGVFPDITLRIIFGIINNLDPQFVDVTELI